MSKTIGRNRNTYTDVNAPLEITLNSATYTEILPPNTERIGYKITRVGGDILVKEMKASKPDQLDRGFEVKKNVSYQNEPDQVPVGIISAKARVGSPTILVVEE